MPQIPLFVSSAKASCSSEHIGSVLYEKPGVLARSHGLDPGLDSGHGLDPGLAPDSEPDPDPYPDPPSHTMFLANTALMRASRHTVRRCGVQTHHTIILYYYSTMVNAIERST